jgi:HemY protein
MWLVFVFVVALAAIAFGLEWVVDHPGSMTLVWGDYRVETSIATAVAVLAVALVVLLLLWTMLTSIIGVPWRLKAERARRSRERGFDAITRGIAAVAAGDAALARKAALDALKHLPGEPLTKYLKAQAAQLEGDAGKAEAAFHEMTLHDDTKLLGLRGLHIEAKRRDDAEAAHHFAKAAHEIAPLPWAGQAIWEHHTALGEWEQARAAIEASFKANAFDYATAQRLRAVIETALATEKQRDNPPEALHLAHMALKRRPGFTPAAVVAARMLTKLGQRKQALKLIEGAWAKAPHPDLGAAYLEALGAESNTLALQGVERLARIAPAAVESRHLVAQAALAARDFAKAREALTPLVAEGAQPTAHTCLLMAEIEDAENGPSGPVREWLARGSRAPRDPVWIADGVVSRSWAPISPKTGRLDAFEWAPPPDTPPGVAVEGRSSIPAAFAAPGSALVVAPAPPIADAAQ